MEPTEHSETLFFVMGIALAVWATIIGVLGFRLETFPPSKGGQRLLMLITTLLVLATTSSAVIVAS